MKDQEHNAKFLSTPKSGSLSALAKLRCAVTGAPWLRVLAVLAVAAWLVVSADSALALPLSFGERGSGAGQMETSRGIAIDQQNGDVYVNDTYNSRADKFGPEGEFKLAFGWGVRNGAEELQTCGPEASPPTSACLPGIFGYPSVAIGQFGNVSSGVAVDNSGVPGRQGDIYFQDSPGRVTKFGPHGEFLLVLGGGVDRGPHHPGNLCTAAFIAEGDTCGTAADGTGPGEFNELRGNPLAVGSTGTLYVGDEERIQKFSPGGALEGQMPLPGVAVEEIAVDSTGDIYVAGYGSGGVRKYNATGTELGEPRDASTLEYTLITIGPSNELFVTKMSGRKLPPRTDIFDEFGKQLSSFPIPTDVEGASGIVWGSTIERLYILSEQPVKVDLLALPPPGPSSNPARAKPRKSARPTPRSAPKSTLRARRRPSAFNTSTRNRSKKKAVSPVPTPKKPPSPRRSAKTSNLARPARKQRVWPPPPSIAFGSSPPTKPAPPAASWAKPPPLKLSPPS